MLFISHISALEYWRSFPESMGRRPYSPSSVWNRQCNLGARSICVPKTEAIVAVHGRLLQFKQPLHCLIPHQRCRRVLSCAACHVYSRPLPSCSFVHIADGVYVASPMLCLIQMAEVLPRFDVMKLGYELMGSYRLSPTDRRGFADARPVMTLREMGDYLRNQKGLRGAKAVAQCLPFVLPDSASPKETQ